MRRNSYLYPSDSVRRFHRGFRSPFEEPSERRSGSVEISRSTGGPLPAGTTLGRDSGKGGVCTNDASAGWSELAPSVPSAKVSPASTVRKSEAPSSSRNAEIPGDSDRWERSAQGPEAQAAGLPGASWRETSFPDLINRARRPRPNSFR